MVLERRPATVRMIIEDSGRPEPVFENAQEAPLDQLPHWMVTLARALPLYHVVISLVDPWNGHGTNLLQLTIVGGIGLATTLLAAGLFQWE